jgi:hypothetical protein
VRGTRVIVGLQVSETRHKGSHNFFAPTRVRTTANTIQVDERVSTWSESLLLFCVDEKGGVYTP